ncbi:MAG: replicative DNA helicase [Prevotellaceae bacterium]|jgi:replicative DNA helicase|nr:replicative DNA helicase [Prevotellaceae bacterium]
MTKKYTKKDETIDVKDVGLQLGKVPPQALQLEEAVLGSMMIEQDLFIDLQNILKPESFYKESHKKIYGIMQELATAQNPIDLYTVIEKLKSQDILNDVGGEAYLVELTKKVASGAHAEYHARIIAQRFIQRELIRIASNIQKNAFDETLDVNDLLNEAQQEIFNLAEGNITREPQRVNIILHEAMEEIERAKDSEAGVSGIPSGFTAIDRITNGWQRSDLIIAAARPSMGKTAFVLTMARNITIEHKIPVAFFSLEMDSVQLIRRLIVSESKISSEKIRSGDLTEADWAHLERSIKGLTEAPLFIDDTPAMSIYEFRSKARKLKAAQNIQLIIIDYLQLMSGPPELKKMREQEVSAISRALKAIAKELKVPIIALSQLNRAAEVGGNKRPQLSNLRESGAIEQDADLVMFIHRPEAYGFKEDENKKNTEGMAEIIIAKHRNGATAIIELQFIKTEARFAEFENGLPAPPIYTNEIRKAKLNNDVDPSKYRVDDSTIVNYDFDSENAFR